MLMQLCAFYAERVHLTVNGLDIILEKAFLERPLRSAKGGRRCLKQKYWVFASITVFLWGSGSVLIRLAFDTFSVTTLATARCYLAAVVMIIICAINKAPLPQLRDIPLFFVAGAVGFSVYMIIYNLGFSRVTAATGNVVMSSSPIFTAVIAQILFKERIRLLGWVFMGVSFVGILILVLWNGVLLINEGVLWLILTAIFLSAYNMIQRRLTRRYTAIQSTAYSLAAGALLLTPFLPGTARDIANTPPIAIAVLLYLGLGGSCFAYLCWSKALSLAKRSADVANFLYLPSFIAAIIAFIIFSEIPDWGTVIGGAFILFGLYMFQKKA